jgi:hypothetical protein
MTNIRLCQRLKHLVWRNEKAPFWFGDFAMFGDYILMLFSAILELGAGYAGMHVLRGSAFDLMICENLHKTLRLVFDVVLAVPAPASDPYCHAISPSLFLCYR